MIKFNAELEITIGEVKRLVHGAAELENTATPEQVHAAITGLFTKLTADLDDKPEGK